MREPEKIMCSCGGEVGMVDPTKEEEKKYGCGRPGHCVRAFECKKCKTRFTMRLEAPEA